MHMSISCRDSEPLSGHEIDMTGSRRSLREPRRDLDLADIGWTSWTIVGHGKATKSKSAAKKMVKPPKTTTKAAIVLEPALVPIRDAFAGDKKVAEFKSTSLCVNNKVFVMLSKGALVVKLSAARVSELIASGDGKAWDPGHGKAMKEWVAIPATRSTSWIALARESRSFVGA